MKTKQLRGLLVMLLASLIWGAAFVAQSLGMEKIGPFTFSAVRILIGAATLAGIMLVKHGIERKKVPNSSRPFFTKRELVFGSMMGVVLSVACNFQQYSLVYTTPGKTAFITTMYIIFVPIAGLFFKNKVSPFVWGGVGLALVGLYLLCVNPSESGINLGDILALVGSIFFTIQIMMIEKSGETVDSVKLCFLQFFVCGILSTILMFVFETPQWSGIQEAILPLLYAGALSGGVAYMLQIVAQRDVGPTLGSLAMSMESVFAVLTAWILLGDVMSGREAIGCVLMFAAIILAQLSDVIVEKLKKAKKR